MEKIKKILTFIIIVIITLFLSLSFKNWYNKKNYPEISFNRKKISLDTIYNKKQAEIYYSYKNTGNKNLKIFRIETTCACTIPTFNDGLLEPREIDSFKVKYETENKGHFIKEIMVYSNSRTSPDRLTISGYVPFN